MFTATDQIFNPMSSFTRIIYALLFALIVLEPHFITKHLFSLPPAFAQSLITLLLGGIAVIVYLLHQRDVRRKEQERLGVVHVLDQSTNKLKQAYEYIGKLNRRLPLLKMVTSELLSRPKVDKKSRKAIFENLLATAVISIAKAPWGMFRFIDTQQLNTVREFTYNNGHYIIVQSKVSNKELLGERNGNNGITYLNDICVVPTSDAESNTQCVFIFPKNETFNNAADTHIVQAIVDQAQLFYKYVY